MMEHAHRYTWNEQYTEHANYHYAYSIAAIKRYYDVPSQPSCSADIP